MTPTARLTASLGARRTADPGLIGLLGFVIATVAAQLAHLGVQDSNAVFWIGAVFGGFVQVTAGMLSYFKGDDFHFAVYNAFGFYWIVVPGFMLGEELRIFEVTDAERGIFALGFAVIALAFALPARSTTRFCPSRCCACPPAWRSRPSARSPAAHGLSITGAVGPPPGRSAGRLHADREFYWLTLGRRVVPLGPRGQPNPDPES